MATDESEDVRVGDRYVWMDRKITISRIDDEVVDFEVLTDDGKSWSSKTGLPLPHQWIKAGSGPVPQLYCLNHPLREVEPGQFFCPECVDQYAANWAGLPSSEVQEAMATMLEEVKNRER